MENRTKIVCTIGPASEEKAVLKKMVRAGMDVVRINFSHGTYEQARKIIKNVREVSNELGREVAIVQDLQGPKIRLGKLPAEGIRVVRGKQIVFSVKNAIYSPVKKIVPIQYKHLAADVTAGDHILIEDGLIEVRVVSSSAKTGLITCTVVTPGILKSNKGINVPTASISADPLTAKDRRDLKFGLEQGVDFIALSFVRNAEEIENLRKFIQKRKSKSQIIAKIERHEAIMNMDEILKAADAVMVARGDLGVEVPAEYVPIYQKKIIQKCLELGRPVIVATQMLQSMIENPRPTRAEISDVATAIFDHADAIMLSNETAVGRYPVEAAATMARTAEAVEKELGRHPQLLNAKQRKKLKQTDAVCLNACSLADDIGAKWIIAITKGGYTLRELSKHRPNTPIICITPNSTVARQSALVWGCLQTIHVKRNTRNPLSYIRAELKKRKLAKAGDTVVVCNTSAQNGEKLITTLKI
ncbi:pyruvate kinase [Candidatus Peregrinibacteria bacterium CG11_big_fil_rev_8_21_14_0_20_46_8]|nr:MAG: pyruvate kinase [Candidatus Peregrinibacteria bacterium CG11_big_fil_rev_8_21_14_0_20_46_8]